MKKWLTYLVIVLVSIAIGWELRQYYSTSKSPLNPIAQIKPRPLDKYTIDNLSKSQIPKSKIQIGNTIQDFPKYTSYLFSFSFDPTLQNGTQKNVTGVVNVPKGNGPFPLVVMFRGFVDQTIYQSGTGTKRAAEVFADNGYITVAPDFLGYAGSDKEAGDVFESRFQTYTTALTLLASISQPSFAEATAGKWDKKNIFLWAHSNGGQIALTTLEISGLTYPATLWAPLTKPFPFSILVYTDEASDSGKFLRAKLANFEETYDTDLYSFTNYLDRIKAPLQFHQGTGDNAVRPDWSDSFVKQLKKAGVAVDYFKYPGSDHNLMPAWNTVVARDLQFFRDHLQ